MEKSVNWSAVADFISDALDYFVAENGVTLIDRDKTFEKSLELLFDIAFLKAKKVVENEQ